MWGVLACLAISAAYVLPLQLLSPRLPRNHPVTIKRRTLCVLGTCCTAWLPVGLLSKVGTVCACGFPCQMASSS